MNDIVKEALNAKYVIISKCGPHAGELELDMFRRKQRETADSAEHWAFWYYKSRSRPPMAVPRLVQEFCMSSRVSTAQDDVYCVFYNCRGGGQQPESDDEASHYSEENSHDGTRYKLPSHFKLMPSGIHTTGYMVRDAYAMVLGELTDVRDPKRTVCLWDYSKNGHPGSAIWTDHSQNSTYLCEKASSHGDKNKMYEDKQGEVKIVGIGKLVKPYSVWLAFVDPVCRRPMQSAKAKCECNGRTYSFCGPECKELFTKDPSKYEFV